MKRVVIQFYYRSRCPKEEMRSGATQAMLYIVQGDVDEKDSNCVNGFGFVKFVHV